MRCVAALLASMLWQAPPTAGRAPAVAAADLRNFTFNLGAHASVDGGKVPLVDGKWVDPEGGGNYTLHPIHALGDLDGDGAGDAMAIVVESTAGTGSFSYLFAVSRRENGLVQLGEPEWLGDRTVIRQLAIDRKGVVTIRYVTHADGDPSCCPTMKIEDKYRVEGGRLVGLVK